MSGGMTGKNKLRGQMALKSSPLNPSSGKLMSQHLVIDHMTAHYKKLLNAKSAIDASVPKAYVSSQKVRDRETRKSVLSGKSPKRAVSNRPQSARSFNGAAETGYSRRPASARYSPVMLPFEDDELQGFSQEEIDCINAMVSDTIDSERLDRALNAEGNPRQGTARSRSSVNSNNRMMPSKGMQDSMRMDTGLRKKMSADILEKRNHVFTDGNMFTPRTLRSAKYKNVPSKLSQTKHFRPAHGLSNRKREQAHAASHNDSEMLDETIMSRDFATRLTMSGTVPRLDISVDQDHMKWLQEQSARHESSRYNPLEKELQMEAKHEPYLRRSLTQERIRQEDESMAYLDFITEVTNDVLTRGIFTNRVLDKVFDEHVERNKDQLSESRMRGMLDSLREDLGIGTSDFRAADEDVGMGSLRPAVRSQTKTTGYNGDPKQFKAVKLGTYESDKASDSPETGDQPFEQRIDALGGELMLADILETSEKSQSNRSSHLGKPGRRGMQETATLSKPVVVGLRKPAPAAEPQQKNKDSNDLLDILGLEDVESLQNQPINESETKAKDADTTSLKSSSKHHSSTGKTLSSSSKDKSQPAKLEGDQASEKSSKWNSSIHKENKSGSGRTTPTTLTKPTSADEEAVSKEDEKEEMESNADFGKTTLFAKTRDMNMTYKALSQVSDEEEDHDYKEDFDDDF